MHHPENQAAILRFLAAPNISDISFAMFYETWDLSYDPDRGYADLDRPGFAPPSSWLAQMADAYFGHPSSLRVGDRPVVILYLLAAGR